MKLREIHDPHSVITPIENGVTFPEVLQLTLTKYEADITHFVKLVEESASTAELLQRIRSNDLPAERRMSLLKMFRRSVSLVCDTETTKKINKVSTASLVEAFGHTFKPIDKLREQFADLGELGRASLAVLLGEYDTRGQQGYQLTEMFFDWFETTFPGLSIEGPRRAGKDIELSSIFPEFDGGYPCDFVIREDRNVIAVGFARYDSTRGGAQSDDRTGGNANKVEKARHFSEATGRSFRILFLADGPGLAHGDTWKEACDLDDCWNDNVRVTTLKTAPRVVTLNWLRGRG